MANINMHDLISYMDGIGKSIFTLADISKITGKESKYLSLLLSKSRYVSRIERGKYYTKNADILQIASMVVFPSYISLFAALRYYSLTTQELKKISVITTRRHKNISVQKELIAFKQINKKRLFGFIKKEGIFIANIEKAIIDSLYFKEPPYSYVLDAFRRALADNLMDIQKLQHYCILMESKTLRSIVGYMLESEGINADKLYPGTKKYIKISGIKPIKNRWRIK